MALAAPASISNLPAAGGKFLSQILRAATRLRGWSKRVPIRRSFCSASSAACARSEEHTSELQSLMRISYAVFCLKKKTHKNNQKQQLETAIKDTINTANSIHDTYDMRE